MSSPRSVCLVVMVLLSPLSACSSPIPTLHLAETVLDSVVHLQDSLITAIPEVGRLCDHLSLDKRRVAVGDAGLSVELEGRGPPLVLLHGGPGATHHYFHPWFSAASGFATVIYYDQRGCGESDFHPGASGYTVEQAVTDLEELRRALGLDRWIVLGHSYGGFLAQYYALRHPERLSGLVLVGADPGLWDRIPTRQYAFLLEEEHARLRTLRTELTEWSTREAVSPERSEAVTVYNNFLNGDWKRQHFHRPTAARVAQIARYEWVHDFDGFRSAIAASKSRVNLAGAFEDFPVPTVILEGDWDLTWVSEKSSILARNHPRAQLVHVQASGHYPFEDEPGRFFRILGDFVRNLRPTADSSLSRFREQADAWDRDRRSTPEYLIRACDGGRESLLEVARHYDRSWIETLTGADAYFQYLQTVGLALYEVERYREGVEVFLALQRAAEDRRAGQEIPRYVGLLWQGHLLDLLGRRTEAVTKYEAAAAMRLEGRWAHPEYGLRFEFTPYAESRIREPFVRMENQMGEGSAGVS